MLELNIKLNELFNMLDQFDSIKKIKEIKKKIGNEELLLINNYRNNQTLENKKKLYENKIISDYLNYESDINYLIMQINQKFKGGKICQK